MGGRIRALALCRRAAVSPTSGTAATDRRDSDPRHPSRQQRRFHGASNASKTRIGAGVSCGPLAVSARGQYAGAAHPDGYVLLPG